MVAVVVRGAGDVGSAVAHVLYRAGYVVLIHDVAHPSHPRRGMSFTNAFFRGEATLDAVLAKRARSESDLRPMLRCRRAIPVSDEDLLELIRAVLPDVLVDARMRKHQQPESQRDLAPLTIGLGPGFVAPDITDIAVETAWGPQLGRVLSDGRTLDQAGEPREIAAHGRDRLVYASISGIFRTPFDIGDHVTAGERVATIADAPVYAPMSGTLRGLTHDHATVTAGAKVIEIDPRTKGAQYLGLGERPQRIAEAVLGAITAELGKAHVG